MVDSINFCIIALYLMPEMWLRMLLMNCKTVDYIY